MQFLCLGYYDAEAMDSRPEAEIQSVMTECMAVLPELYATGRVIVDAGLEQETRSLTWSGGKVGTREGRLFETREKIGSAFIIEADDFEDAVSLAAMHPSAKVSAGEAFGWAIEIRPIHYFRQPGAA